MSGSRASRIEAVADRTAAAIFAVAVGYVLLTVLRDVAAQPQLSGYAGGAAIAAYWLCARALESIPGDDRRFEMTIFDPALVELVQPDELVLAAADVLAPPESAAADELLLDDLLAKIGPDSRVVRLFDAAAMPTSGQVNTRIEEHLSENRAAPPDASQALYDALAELRRSLH